MRVLHPFYFNRKAFVYYSCHKKSEYFHEVRGNKKYLVFGICVAFVLLGAFAGVSVGGGVCKMACGRRGIGSCGGG